MGRAKVTLKCIEKDKARQHTFKGRANGLMKKMKEFCTKTGVDAFLIVYESNDKSQPMTWPKESEKVCSMIENYEANKIEKPPKNFDLEDFFEIRKSMVQDEISKVRKDILQIKYPTWNSNFNSLDEEHLMKFIAILDTKIIACNQQIGMLKSNQQGRGSSNFNVWQSMVESTSVSTNPNPNPNPNQLNFKQSSTPQIQVIPDPDPNPDPNLWLPLYQYNQLAASVDHGFGGSQSQMSHIDPNHVELVANNNEISVAFANQVGVQQNNGNVDPTTNDQFGEFLDWAKFGGEDKNWASQPNDTVDWTSEYFLESEFQNNPIHFQNNVSSQLQDNVSSQFRHNVSQPLNIVPPLIMDEVLIYDYSNNMFQDQPFYNMNHK